VQWRRDVAFSGYQVNIQMDISAERMIFGVAGVDPKRREELIKASSLLFQSFHLCNE
jgi:CCR4-NOT complex subunit CAF16